MALLQPEGLNNHVVRCAYLASPVRLTNRIWTKEILRPYIVYLHQGQVIDSFFGGLLFEADRNLYGETLSAKAIGFGKSPTINGWKQSIQELFAFDRNLGAALELSKERPFAKLLDIWIALPYPIVTKDEFGTLDGKGMAFSESVQSRKKALKWWIDEVLNAWNQLSIQIPGHQARFCGFVWSKSSLDHEDDYLMQRIAKHIHKHQLKLIWIQNYGTGRSNEGYSFGVDLIFTRPTYTGTDPRGVNWIEWSTMYSAYQNFGLVLLADPRLSEHHGLDFLNLGVGKYDHAFQIYELADRMIFDLYQKNDPQYVYYYAYTKNCYTMIRYPDCKY